jgi:urease accessory protein
VARAAELPGAGSFAANRAFGKVSLKVHADAGLSRRTRVREEGSLRVRFPGAPGRALEAVVINTAGGIAGGDSYALEATAGDGATLVLTTASAEKVYRSLGDDATLDIALRAEAGADIAWMPRETILFDRSRLARTIDIELAEDARLLLAEAVMFGRAGMGEAVDHGRLFDRWRIRRGGRLVYADSIRLDGNIADELQKTAVAAGHVAVATILLYPADDRFVAALRESAPRLRGEVGASTWNGLTAARFCARDGESLRHDMMTALSIALDGPLPKLWLN